MTQKSEAGPPPTFAPPETEDTLRSRPMEAQRAAVVLCELHVGFAQRQTRLREPQKRTLVAIMPSTTTTSTADSVICFATLPLPMAGASNFQGALLTWLSTMPAHAGTAEHSRLFIIA